MNIAVDTLKTSTRGAHWFKALTQGFKLLGLTLYWALLTFSKPYIPLQNNALKLYFVLCSLFMLSLYRLQIAYELQCKKGKRLRQ